MPSLIDAFTINGLIDTNQSVISNINRIADAAAVWVTYDVNSGLWSINYNDVTSSTYSFTDNNIIGGINVSGTGLTECYNKVTVEFPHKDLRDQTDYVDVSIPLVDRFQNERNNQLNISLDLVNNPVQAQYIATVELKQSRLDKVIEFRTDWSAWGVRAGDVISVTNTPLGFTNKLFRVTKIEEIDNDDGNIELSITGLEYDPAIYSTSGLVYEERTKITGIPPKITNTTLAQKDDLSAGTQLLRLLGLNLLTGLFNSALTKNPITGKVTQTVSPTSADRDAALSKFKKPGVVISGASSICEGATLNLTLTLDCASCLFDPISYNYTITGIQSADINPFPLTGTVTVPGSMSIPIVLDGTIENETMTVTVGSVTKTVTILDKLGYTYITTASPTSVTEGASSTVTLTTTNVANGTTIPYEITGDTSRISTATSGTVTVNSNSATLVINTIDDAVYQGTGSVTVTFNSAQVDNCNELDKTASITILDNDTPPPEPPQPPADTTCSYVTVPVVWCGVYDGTDNQLKNMTVRKTAQLPVPLAGEASVNVPLTVSVTKGNPSTVTVLTTAAVASSSSLGGTPFNVIYNFNTVAPKGLITGTSYVIYGY